MPEPRIHLRPEEPGDAGPIAALIAAAFGRAAEAQLVARCARPAPLPYPSSRSTAGT